MLSHMSASVRSLWHNTRAHRDITSKYHQKEELTSTLIFGPLNHFLAEMNHHAITKKMLSTESAHGYNQKRHGHSLRSKINNYGPVHTRRRQIVALRTRKAQNRHHHHNEKTSRRTDWLTPFPQMPRASSESITNEEYPDEDRNGKGYHGSNCSH